MRGGRRKRERGWDSLRLCFWSRNLISTSCYKVVFLTVVFLLCLCIFFSSHSYQIVQYSKYYQNNIKSGHTQFQIKTKITSDIKILITLKGRGMLFPTYFFFLSSLSNMKSTSKYHIYSHVSSFGHKNVRVRQTK